MFQWILTIFECFWLKDIVCFSGFQTESAPSSQVRRGFGLPRLAITLLISKRQQAPSNQQAHTHHERAQGGRSLGA
jgi:hypothetical protein